MQVQARFGNWSLAMGVDWRLLESSAEVKAERREHPKQQFVLQMKEGRRWLGFHTAGGQKVYAAALLVGMVVPNAVIYVPLSDAVEGAAGYMDAGWVCAIQDGMPVIQHDLVLPLSEARSKADEWAAEFGNTEMIGALPDSQLQLPELIERLEQALLEKTLSKRQVASAMLQSGGVPIKPIAITLAVMLGITGSYYSYKAFSEMRERERVRLARQAEQDRLAQQGARNKAELDQIRKRSRDTFEQQVAHAREAQRERVAPRELLAAVTGVRQALPISAYGYKPTSMDCSDRECRVAWQGAGRFTSALDKMRLPNVEATLTQDLTAVSVFPIQPTKQALLPAVPATSAEELKFLMQTAMALHGTAFTVEADFHAVTVNPPKGLDVPPRVVARTGRWRLALTGTTALVDAGAWMDLLARWPIRVTAIRHNSAGLEASGDYVYVDEGGS